ncbi:anti-sigma factor family protein [Streptomyces phyllanthi]|uniref:Zinc-finger domain-containing protein n=1 Tax=Streptomyces phyllanthi TaxID=1803180 RepID=A0A5N8VZ94_9ACTN|nr:hypothetical protein [Streptomyces phyllanthi]MPY39368.1 hypothetical protein [Streptomyces phyllanthi]
MTSTTDTAEHPEVTELSDLTEGLLPPSRMSDLRQHLDECPLCADVYASLEEIRGMLGTLPDAPRMPADIAGRIDAALAAEALLDATAPAPEATTTPTSVRASRRESDEDSGVHVSRETSTAADRPAGHSRASTGPGRPDRKRRARRRTIVVGAVFTAATLGFGSLLVQSMGTNSADTPAETYSQDVSTSTFSGDTLKNQVADLLAGTNREGSTSGDRDTWGTATKPPGSTNEPNHNIYGVVDVPPCIAQGIGRSEAPLAYRKGEYEEAPAYLVVLPDTDDTSRVTAYVVDATCVTKKSASPGDVLVKHSFPRS